MLSRILARRVSEGDKICAIHNYTRDVTIEEICDAIDHLPYKAKVEAVKIFLSRGQLTSRNITKVTPYFHSDTQKLEVIQEAVSLPRGIDATIALKLFHQMKTVEGKQGLIIKLRRSFILEQLPLLAKECGYYFILQYFRERIFGTNYIFMDRCSICERNLSRYWFQEKPEIGNSCHQCSVLMCKYCRTIRLWKHGIVVQSVGEIDKLITLLDQSPPPPLPVHHHSSHSHRHHPSHHHSSHPPPASSPHPVSSHPPPPPVTSPHSPVIPPQVIYPNKLDDDISASESERCGLCVVCKIRYHKTVNLPCMHACLCFHCAKRIAENDKKSCPVCREPLTEIKQLYPA